jgi:PIN domain
MDTDLAELGRLLQADPYSRGVPKFLTIVDTDALLSSIDNHARTDRPSRIARLAHSRQVRVFAADHVYGEVYRGFHRIAKTSPCSAEQLQAIFEQQYLPYVRWVTVDLIQPGLDDRVQVVHAIDSTDAPTAQLASLVGPCLVLSGDRSLRSPGFAPDAWRHAAGSAISMIDAEATTEGVTRLVGMPAAGVVAGTVRLGNRLNVPWFVSVPVLAAGMALLLQSPTRRSRIWEKIGPAVEALMDYLAEEQAKERAGRAGLTSAMCESPPRLSTKQQVTIVLARANVPLLASEVQEGMFDHFDVHTVPTATEVRAILRAGAEFAQYERYRWKLGRFAGPWRV